jgi:UDP-N-acetylmuramate dehydrogenase
MTIDQVAHLLHGKVRGTLTRDLNLAGFTTYRLGGPAAVYFEPADVDDVAAFAGALVGSEVADIPVLVMGRGSNLVISDRGWPGVVLRFGAAFSWIEGGDPLPEERAKCVPARADTPMLYEMRTGASTALPQLANWAARRSLAGMEFTVAIPGSVGGAVRMNAGAHGRDIAANLAAATILDLDSLEVAEKAAPELDLSYRRSNLTERRVVLDATFGLAQGDGAAIKARMEAHRKHRSETQPGAVQNAGSVFKNPEGNSAGRLVEAAGLKGFTVGGASVSELHANFFIAGPGSSSQDVYDLVQEVRHRVHEHSGIWLEPEIRFVGDFDG